MTYAYYKDFTEVDNNVTRHVSRELKQKDWSVFVMHYLGMDHIGHKAGPRRFVYCSAVERYAFTNFF